MRIINLNEINNVNIMQQLRSGCVELGFFYVPFAGLINPGLVEEMFAVSREFYALDQTEKNQYLRRGYSAYQTETLDPEHQTEADTKEGFSIKSIAALNTDPQLGLPAKWTNKSHLNVAAITNAYLQAVTQIAVKIITLLAEALEIPADQLLAYVQQPRRYIRMLRYTSRRSAPNNGLLAAGAHSDYGLLTILATDEQPGLQVLDKEGQWQLIPVRPDHFIVNIGDMFEILSGGLCKSPRHRVVNETGLARYSLPFFFNVNENMLVKPLLKVPGAEHYKPTTFLDYLAHKTSRTFKDGITPNQISEY